MVRPAVVQTPFQVLQSVARGLGNLGAFFFGNPAARMVQIVHQDWPRPAAPGTSPVALLRQLAALRAAGLLSTGEFTAKKAQLLSRI